jgi:hypothetical protein
LSQVFGLPHVMQQHHFCDVRGVLIHFCGVRGVVFRQHAAWAIPLCFRFRLEYRRQIWIFIEAHSTP